jgi:hypothetical protein
MRTTVLLPDDLYQQVKLAAAEDRRTVTSLIEESLRAALESRSTSPERPLYRVDAVWGTGVQAGVDLDDNASMIALMDAE